MKATGLHVLFMLLLITWILFQVRVDVNFGLGKGKQIMFGRIKFPSYTRPWFHQGWYVFFSISPPFDIPVSHAFKGKFHPSFIPDPIPHFILT